jgi:hypothetical protein
MFGSTYLYEQMFLSHETKQSSERACLTDVLVSLIKKVLATQI